MEAPTPTVEVLPRPAPQVMPCPQCKGAGRDYARGRGMGLRCTSCKGTGYIRGHRSTPTL